MCGVFDSWIICREEWVVWFEIFVKKNFIAEFAIRSVAGDSWSL